LWLVNVCKDRGSQDIKNDFRVSSMEEQWFSACGPSTFYRNVLILNERFIT